MNDIFDSLVALFIIYTHFFCLWFYAHPKVICYRVKSYIFNNIPFYPILLVLISILEPFFMLSFPVQVLIFDVTLFKTEIFDVEWIIIVRS